MNDFLKKTIIETIKRSDVEIKRQWGHDTYTVKDATGNPLIVFENGYDSGLYSLTISNQTICNIEWYENSKTPMTKEQRDCFDVLKAISMRYSELKKLRMAQKAMNAKEQELVNFLTGTNQAIKQ